MKFPLFLLFSFLTYNVSAQSADSIWYQHLKFRPLNTDKSSYLSFGGELRAQYFHYQNRDWGAALPDHDGFLLSRYLLHADLHVGKHFRTFVQLQSGLSNGEIETPSPVNQNPLDLHEAYVDLMTSTHANAQLTLRVGRQELSYGSQRIVSLRDAPNNRQAFDGVKLIYAKGTFRLENFYTNYVQVQPGIFDDRITSDLRLWGSYATLKEVPLLRNVDFYYLGLKKRKSVYDEGVAAETRHSIGSRVAGNTANWQYDIEGLYQFGKFGKLTISAWTLSANIARTLSSSGLKPLVGLKTEAITGDRNYDDGRLNTFNPLFPKGGYFGLAAVIGPSNLFDIHPYLQIWLAKRLSLTEDYDIFWRLNRNDGIYAVSGRLLYSGRNTLSKSIGAQLGTNLEYNPTSFLYIRGEFTWFKSGAYLREVGPGKDILMSGATFTYKF